MATAAQAAEIEKEWAARSDLATLEAQARDWKLRPELFRERLAANPGSRPRDVLWGMANESLQELMRAGDFQGLKVRYYEMALFVAREGRNPNYLLRASHQAELQGYRQSSVVERVSVLSAGQGNSCAACLALDGKVFTVEDALHQMPIPCPSCATDVVGSGVPFCRCLYSPVID